MAKQKLKSKDLVKLGFPKGTIAGMALQVINKQYPYTSQNEKREILELVLEDPNMFKDEAHWLPVLDMLFPVPDRLYWNYGNETIYNLRDTPKSYKVYGRENIGASAFQQMDNAMRLPVSTGGAMMPDAHHGYGLPIGGVLATENAVIPYAVGMDIGCRMALSIFDLKPYMVDQQKYKFRQMLENHSRFGKKIFDDPMDHPILERPEFSALPIARKLRDKAWKQLGSSGSGNHFVEWGEINILDAENELGVPVGKYLALLTHSGSRGLGAAIAQFYTRLARHLTRLPREAQHLAWLDLDTQAGQEYWMGMELAGDYASACHAQIHHRMEKALGHTPIAMVENHHNFAWKELDASGVERIVHRKGATPAGKGVLGIIPGSMTAPGYLVRGKGEIRSLNSAAHGAGRAMSRKDARSRFTRSGLNKVLADHGVTLIGGGIDESPNAYKDIESVMAMQEGLVDIIGKFQPKMVRMDKG